MGRDGRVISMVYYDGSRDARRALQRRLGNKVQVVPYIPGESAVQQAVLPGQDVPLEQRVCGECGALMGLHPQPDYTPCPTTTLIAGGKKYGLLIPPVHAGGKAPLMTTKRGD